MGSDKSQLIYHNMPQLDFLQELLKSICEKVYISLRPGQVIDAKFDTITDQFEIPSPLNGILSAFKVDSGCAWLIVAVDMPNVDKSVVDLLISKRNKSKVATCFFNESEKMPEPLLTIWEPKAANLLSQFHSQGKMSPREFLNTHNVELLKPPDPKILLNINTRDEYEKFKKS